MSSPAATPRLAGRILAITARVAGSAAGTPIRRFLGRKVVDEKLAGIDLAAAGDPAPFYMPEPWKR
jgi:hypothetical protein